MIVKEIDLFKGLDFEVIKQLADVCEEDWYLKGKVLFKKYEPADRFFVLQKGIVNLVIDDSLDLVYHLSDPGEVIGWSSVFDSAGYTASAVCASDVLSIKIEKEKLDRIFDEHPHFGLAVLRRMGTVFAKRLSHAYQEISSAR